MHLPPLPFPLVPPALWYKEERRKALQGENCISFATLDVSLDVTNLHIVAAAMAQGGYDLSGLLTAYYAPQLPLFVLQWDCYGCLVLFARLALIEDQSCREPQPLRLFETTGFQRGRYDHHHRGNFLIGLPKGGWLACLSDPVRPKTEVRCGLPPSIESVCRSWNWN